MTKAPVVLVTGASRGIGRAIALAFAARGYQTVLTARDTDMLNETARLIAAQGSLTPKTIPAELRQSHDLSRLVGSALENFGKIDVLVNNAGVMYLKPFLEITSDELKEMMDTNLNAIFQLTQRVARSMMTQQSGLIINIASIAGKTGFKYGAGYAASKFALRGFAQSLMLELREHGIRVVSVFPGSVNTDMLEDNPMAASKSSALMPEDIARVVVAAAETDPRATVSEIEIRPSNPRRAKNAK